MYDKRRNYEFRFFVYWPVFLLMLIIPNIIWSKFQPENYQHYVKNENKLLKILERTGESLVTVIVLIFADFNIDTLSLWTLWLAAAFLFMILYEIYWVRYFCSKRTMKDFYCSLLGIPMAGATLPIAAFLLAVYGKNIYLLIAVIILGIGHIGIHLNHRKEVQNEHLSADRRS